MLDQLRQIVASQISQPISIKSLAKYGNKPETPLAATLMAKDFALLAKSHLPEQADTDNMSDLAAIDLIHYLADLPEWILAEIEANNAFVHNIERAWEEPVAGAYVGLCCTVQDVWEHLFGPEINDDAHILRMIHRCAKGPVLDFGCGIGYFSFFLGLKGIQVHCFDTDKIKNSFLAFRIKRHGLEANMSLQQSAGEYQAILLINVLDHLEWPDKTLQSLVEQLTESGYAIVSALFPTDGWHQSDPAKIQATFASLNNSLSLCADDNGPGPDSAVEVWQKPVAEKVSGDSQSIGIALQDYKPRLHPKVVVVEHPDDEDLLVLNAHSFYISPVYIDKELIPLVQSFDGGKSLSLLCQEFEFELEELEGFLSYLKEQRLVF